jgi:Uma2 family endonuclease
MIRRLVLPFHQHPAPLPAFCRFPSSPSQDIFDGSREIDYTRGVAQPARKPSFAPQEIVEEDEPGILLQRWAKGADGEMELLELPLTPELFLNPKHGDKWMRGGRHHRVTHELFGLLDDYFQAAPDVLVTSDLQHVFAPRLPKPCPDVSVIRGIRDRRADRYSFKAAKERTVPCLIVEVVSPLDSEIRETDLKRKVQIYERAGVREYVIVDSTLQDRRFRLLGYRLDRSGHYRPIQPDADGRFLSETTGLWFQVSPDGERIFVFEYPGGRRLLNLQEEKERAEAAEAENARLKAEIDRLRRGQ